MKGAKMIERTITVTLTPEEVAEAFANFAADQQAAAISEIAKLQERWGPGEIDTQAYYVSGSSKLTESGRAWARKFAEHINQ
jgi:hypothetical protein